MLLQPDLGYAKEYAVLPTAAVSDALDRLGILGQCARVRALEPRAAKLCGRAFTVQFLPCGPPDARTPNGRIGEYIDDVPAGYVIALDNRGNLDFSIWDDASTRIARNRGIAGIVIDGACRGHPRAGAAQYPLFAVGTQSRSGQDRVRVEACNLPIVIGGVRVECDDILLGDEDGLVVVPRDHLAAVLATTREIIAARG